MCMCSRTVQRCLEQLTADGCKRALDFILSGRLWGLVYDNLNLTKRQASQRLDTGVQQHNITTSAIFSLPTSFTSDKYSPALEFTSDARDRSKRKEITLASLMPTSEQQQQLVKLFRHYVRTFLVDYVPGDLRRKRHRKHLMKQIKSNKFKLRVLDHEKTVFFPLPAVDQEEASVLGTAKVLNKIFVDTLKFTPVTACEQTRFVVGDWLTIRNLRLLRGERPDEFDRFERMDWIQEASMPFHFQLNEMWAICRTHIGHSEDNDPASLEAHRKILRRYKLDGKKPDYNQAKQLVRHSLIARVLDCAQSVPPSSSLLPPRH